MSTLWPHQEEAVARAVSQKELLLHCGMGTGKTLITLETLRRTKAQLVLVLCPLAVASVWPRELTKHGYEHWHVEDLSLGTIDSRAARLDEALKRHTRVMVVVNYDAFWRPKLLKLLLSYQWDCVVADEAHRLKAPWGKAAKAARLLRTTRKLALSGTPMPHSPMDAWSLMRWLQAKTIDPSFVIFRSQFAVVVKINNHPVIKGFKNLDRLSALMAPYTFHVDRSVLKLPPVVPVDVNVYLEKATARVYRELEDNSFSELQSGKITQANGMVKMLRLRQVTGGFVGVPEGETDEVGIERIGFEKECALVELLSDLEPDESVVVFCMFSEDLAAVRRACASEDVRRSYYELSGNAKEQLQWSKVKGAVLGTQTQAGSEGVDLTASRHCVFFSLGWSYGQHDQAMARVHRPGQTRTTHYYNLLASTPDKVKTVDWDVLKSLLEHRNTVQAVIDGIKRRRGLEPTEDTRHHHANT